MAEARHQKVQRAPLQEVDASELLHLKPLKERQCCWFGDTEQTVQVVKPVPRRNAQVHRPMNIEAWLTGPVAKLRKAGE
ncbi:hypothetical protein D7V80_12655 [Corallococcus sp. CA054B]|nr:hypothetical protein D7V80_12655 [Corallococcus sp. CA054B]